MHACMHMQAHGAKKPENQLTGNIDDSRLAINVPAAGPGDALALELVLAEVLLDLVARYVELALDYPGARVRIDKVLLEVVLDALAVAAKVDLEGVRGLAVQGRRLVLHDVGVDGLGEEDRQVAARRDELRVRGYRRRGHVVLLQRVRVLVLRADNILASCGSDGQMGRVFFF